MSSEAHRKDHRDQRDHRDHKERPQGQSHSQRPSMGHHSSSSGASRSGSTSSSNVFSNKLSSFSKHQSGRSHPGGGSSSDRSTDVGKIVPKDNGLNNNGHDKSRKNSTDVEKSQTKSIRNEGASGETQKTKSPDSKPTDAAPPKAKSTSLSSYLKKVKQGTLNSENKKNDNEKKDEVKKASTVESEPVKEADSNLKKETKDIDLPRKDMLQKEPKEVESNDLTVKKEPQGDESESEDHVQETTEGYKQESTNKSKESHQKESSIPTSASKETSSIPTDINTSPLSQLSSEMNPVISPRKSRSQRYISDDDDDDELSDVGDTIEINRPRRDRVKVNVEDDSDAETVHGDSPPNNRSEKYNAKDGNISDASDKANQEEADYHKKIIQERLDRRSASKSSSPHRMSTKKIKKTRDTQGRLKLQKVCEKGDYEQAKMLIEQGADVNDNDYAGNTALHEAALQGHTDVVELLLENGADPNKQTGAPDLDTPLIDAASSMDTKTIQLLLKFGADPSKQNTNGDNAFDSVLEDENTDQIKDLMRKAYLKLKEQGKDSLTLREHTKYDDSFVDLATKEGRSELYCNALKADQVFVGKHLGLGGKPDKASLGVAAKYGNYDIVNLFLAFGCNADSYDADGTTPLMNSVGKGHIDVVRLLLESGANPLKHSKDGKSVLEFADDSLVRDDEEIQLIKDAISAKAGSNDERESNKKRKSNTREDLEQPDKRKQQKQTTKSLHEHKQKEVKSKQHEKVHDQHRAKDMSRAKSSEDDNRGARRDHHKDTIKQKERSQSKGKPEKSALPNKEHHLQKSESSKASNPKSEPMKKSHSNNTTSSHAEESAEKSSEKPTKPEPIPHVETEEEKAARLLKEKEDQKKREEFEAAKTAKRKEREMQFLMDFENEEQRKEEEVRKLARDRADQKEKELRENEAKAKLEEEMKTNMSRKEETERRRKLREEYPFGLQQATFDGNRTKEDVLKYLPLYYFNKDGVKYCCDLQAILIVGVEKFYTEFPSFTDSRIELTLDDKSKFFNYLYPFLGNFSLRSIDRRLENKKEEFRKFSNLAVHWIKYDDFLDVIKNNYTSLSDVVTNRSLEVILNLESTANNEDDVLKTQNTIKESASNSMAGLEKTIRLPHPYKNRHNVEKVLLRNRKLW